MILRIEDLKDKCALILQAIDTNSTEELSDSVDIKVVDSILTMSVSNSDYCVKVKLLTDFTDNFHTVVKANTFLKLISQTTSDTVELIEDTANNNLIVKGNGTYKLESISNDTTGELVVLPEIDIINPTQTFTINRENLTTIIRDNTKELTRNASAVKKVNNLVQQLYYLDKDGCITFTNGACVNNFNIDTTVKLLLPQKLVKLFKLINSENATCILGQDAISDEIIQTKFRIFNDTIEITYKLPVENSSLVTTVPVAAIRGLATDVYSASAVLNKVDLLQAFSRLLLFVSNKAFVTFKFSKDCLEIVADKSSEKIYYENAISLLEDYICTLDLLDFKATLETYKDSFVTVNFGNSKAIAIIKNNVTNIIAECH